MDKKIRARKSRFTSTTLALAVLLLGCDEVRHRKEVPARKAEQVDTTQCKTDLVCTADPTRDFHDEKKRIRFDGSSYPNGIDFYRVNVVGPHCQSDPGTPGYDARCCPVNETKAPANYTACKTEQAKAVDEFLKDVRAKIPLLPPFRVKNIVIQQGYYYDWDVEHGAVDFHKSSLTPKEDPGFDVYAPADGKVIHAAWEGPTAGNIILLQHDLPDGSRYFTEYRHVRGGATHDKKAACSCIDLTKPDDQKLKGCLEAEKKGKYYKYCLYAANSDYDSFWGDDSVALPPVWNPNDPNPPAKSTVSRGEVFAKAGNTGAVFGTLDASTGKPADEEKANTHLHFQMWMPRPKGVEDGKDGPDVILVDPYGVYSKAEGSIDGKGCYALDAPSTYARLLAPHLPEFFDTPYRIAVGNGHSNYYPNAGWGLQAFSVYNSAGEIMATGAYDPNAELTGFKFWPNLSKNFMEEKVALYTTRKVRQLSVRLEGGAPRYTAIWEAEAPSEDSEVYLDRSTAELNQLLSKKVTNGPFGILDYAVHVINGVPHHNISFATSIGKNYSFYSDRTAAEAYSAQKAELSKKNFKPFAVSATEGNGGSSVRFSILFRPMTGSSSFKLDMSAEEFASELASRKAAGSRLLRSQGYDNGTKFLGLWHKP